MAIDQGAFEELDVVVEWYDFPAGTGAIMDALAANDIDIATPLTEGAVTSIANGNPSRIVEVWVDSPLLWGIHVAAHSAAHEIGDIAGQRFAISRFGSGSELMSRVLAEDEGWSLDEAVWVLVENLEGALRALTTGEAEIFLWNKSMTQPHVDDGTLRRIGILPTPWPSFAVVATNALLHDHADLARGVADAALAAANDFAAQHGAAQLVAERFGLEPGDAAEWLAQVRWPKPGSPVDLQMLTEVVERMRNLGRLEGAIVAAELIA